MEDKEKHENNNDKENESNNLDDIINEIKEMRKNLEAESKENDDTNKDDRDDKEDTKIFKNEDKTEEDSDDDFIEKYNKFKEDGTKKSKESIEDEDKDEIKDEEKDEDKDKKEEKSKNKDNDKDKSDVESEESNDEIEPINKKLLDIEDDDNNKVEKKKGKKDLKEKDKKGKKKGKKKKHKKLKIFILSFLALIVIGAIAVVGTFWSIFNSDKWEITEAELLSDAGAKVYDKDGKEIASLTGDEINKKIELSEMGKLPDAFISIEDERFYEHQGVDIKRTAGAIFKYITSFGKGSFGGSTITQQLVKVTMKDDEQSGWAGIQRKIREWSRATQVEKMLTKDQILQRYLNRIYLGSANGLEVRGVESAANYYFSKSAKDLSIAEASFLAGINHAPSLYNPFTSEEEDIGETIKTRTLTVIGKMHDLGKINDEEYNAAVEETKNGLNFKEGSVSNGKSDISYHTAAAINQIANELSDEKDISYDEARELLINSGYSIYTTVDSGVQEKLESVYKDSDYIFEGTNADSDKDSSGQSGMVIIEPSTGYVVAESGGIGAEQSTLGLNRALSKRQGGSAFKPLVTVAPGLENKIITAATLFNDVQTNFGSYKVSNDSASYHGIENMRSILTHSCNVPEVKILSMMGISKSADFLDSIGIEVNRDEVGLSMALGTVDVSPLQMAAGYAMIVNGGTYIEPTFYTKVVDRDGKTVIESKQEKTRVMSEENAYIECSLLKGPVQSGTASNYANYLGSMDVAGKTGTTETAGDRWFCGFTPYYAAACWYGNDNNNGEFHNGACDGHNPAALMWFDSMKKIHADLENKDFTEPEGIKRVTICRATGRKATDKCTDTYTEIFASSNIPAACTGHETVKICVPTGKKATEYCPQTEEKTFGYILDTEKDATWSPKQEVVQAPKDTCDVHINAPDIDVPNVVGSTQEEATKALEKLGFKVKIEKDSSNKMKKGVVIKQSATKASKGAEITITINQIEGKETNTTNTTTNTITNTVN